MRNYSFSDNILYSFKELNPEDEDSFKNFFEFDSKPIIEGTAIEINNSGFTMIEEK